MSTANDSSGETFGRVFSTIVGAIFGSLLTYAVSTSLTSNKIATFEVEVATIKLRLEKIDVRLGEIRDLIRNLAIKEAEGKRPFPG